MQDLNGDSHQVSIVKPGVSHHTFRWTAQATVYDSGYGFVMLKMNRKISGKDDFWIQTMS